MERTPEDESFFKKYFTEKEIEFTFPPESATEMQHQRNINIAKVSYSCDASTFRLQHLHYVQLISRSLAKFDFHFKIKKIAKERIRVPDAMLESLFGWRKPEKVSFSQFQKLLRLGHDHYLALKGLQL